MRIGLVSQQYPPETAHGGIGTQTYLKAHGLASLGHEVHVISHSTDAETHHYEDGDVQVTRIPGFDEELSVESEIVRWIAYSLRVAAAISDLHKAKPLDLVDFPEWGCEGYVHLLNRINGETIPSVVHLHGPLVMLSHTLGWPEPDSEFYRTGAAMEATCLRLADAVFSSSRCSAEWCGRYYDLQPEDVPIIHTGVDTQLFRPLDVPKAERPTIVFVGKIVRNKGVEQLLEAALNLAETCPGLCLRMIGPGEKNVENALRDRARISGFPGLLELVGPVRHADLPRYLSEGHVFAAPSKYEGGPGLVYLEAMACGLPVVACAGSGASEVVEHDLNGLLVAPEDVQGLEEALGRLLSDGALRKSLGSEGRRRAETEFDKQICLNRMEAFYLAVVETLGMKTGSR